MQESITHINLFNRPPIRDCKRQYSPNDNWFDNWIVSFNIIKVRSLAKTFGNKSCLIPFHIAISPSFDFENPFATHNIHRRPRVNNGPSAIFEKSIKFSGQHVSMGKKEGNTPRSGGRQFVLGREVSGLVTATSYHQHQRASGLFHHLLSPPTQNKKKEKKKTLFFSNSSFQNLPPWVWGEM